MSMPRSTQSCAYCSAVEMVKAMVSTGFAPGLLHVLTDHRNRIPARQMRAAERDVIEQHAPRPGKGQPVEHVIGDEMRKVVALVRGPGDRIPRNTAPLGDRE